MKYQIDRLKVLMNTGSVFKSPWSVYGEGHLGAAETFIELDSSKSWKLISFFGLQMEL